MAAIQQINTKKNLVIAEVESVEGTDAVDAAIEASADIFYQDVAIPQWNKVRIPVVRDPARSHRQFPTRKTVASHMDCSLSGSFTEWEGGGAGAEAPVWRMYPISAGFSESIVGATSATYTLDAGSYAAASSMSQWHLIGNANSTLHRLTYGTGGRGNFTFSGTAGQAIRWNWAGRFANYNPWSDDLAFFAGDGTPQLGNDGAALGGAYTGTDIWNPAPEFCLLNATASWNSGATVVPIESFTVNPNLSPVNRIGASATTLVENVYLDVLGPPLFTVTAKESNTVLDAFLAAADADTVDDFVITWESTTCKVTVNFPTAMLDIPRMTSDANLATWEYAFQAYDDYNTAVPASDMSIVIAAP